MTTPIFPQVDPNTGALPPVTEARYIPAGTKNIAGGVAALNGSGLPVDTSGRPMAVIGTASGTAADAAVVAAALAGKAVIGTTTGTAADAAVVTAALAGKASTSAVPAEADTYKNHWPVAVTGGTAPYRFPPRPAWQGPVVFNMMGLNCELPGNDGQLTGGGGMYPLRDELRT